LILLIRSLLLIVAEFSPGFTAVQSVPGAVPAPVGKISTFDAHPGGHACDQYFVGEAIWVNVIP
jgi:hypothetical protein